jgi:peptide/nickel transport system permease protein
MDLFFRGLQRRLVARISFYALLLLYFGMIFAEFLAPYRPTTVFRNHGYHPPALTFWSKELGFGPQVQEQVLIDEINRRYVRVRGQYHRVRFFVAGPPYRMWGLIPMDIHLYGTGDPYEEGGRTWAEGGQNYPVFLFGADHLGRDMASRILYGSRVSLTIGFIGVSIALFLAILLGGLSGFYGGWVDWLIMRMAEFFILIPGLYMILFLRSILSRNLDPGQSFVLITVILSFVGWPGTARLIRGMVHAVKREDFIAAAQLEGIPSLVIIFRQIVPQISSILIVSVALGIPGFILGETVLSYLGLGIVDPAVSWGSLLNREITTVNNLVRFPWFLVPGLFLLVTTLAFNFLGDLLRDVLDPYHRERTL